MAAVYNILAHIDLYDFGRVEMQGVCLPEIRTSHLEIDLLRSYQVCACLRVCVCVAASFVSYALLIVVRILAVACLPSQRQDDIHPLEAERSFFHPEPYGPTS